MAALIESGMRNLTAATPTRSASSRCAPGSGTAARTRATPTARSSSSTGSSTTPKRCRRSASRAGLPIDDPKHYGDWIADVERPAEQYRGRYQLRLDEARELLRHGPPAEELAAAVDAQLAGGGLAGTGGGRRGAAVPRHAVPLGRIDAADGLRLLGPGPVGLREGRHQHPARHRPADHGAGRDEVDRDHLLPGDLIFFRDDSGYVHHVGMSLGGKKFIHAPHTGDVVKISSLNEAYYAQQFTGGRRFDPALGDNRARVMAAITPDQVTRR